MGILSPQPTGTELDLQAIIDQQANALQLLHMAFAAERQAWSLERERMHQRIASLESLLRNGDHHSPAKSPVLSPLNGSITSPQSRAITSITRLPIITEDEDIQGLSERRVGAPQYIDIPGRPPVPGARVSFSNPSTLKVDEVPISPPTTARALSPLPPHNRAMAGHTPLKASRVPTPPPQNMALDGMEDTPTRHNTHINSFPTQSDDGEEEEFLHGPLILPELPTKPGATNFTLEALSKRLEQIEQDPEDIGRPTVLSHPNSGLDSPTEAVAAGKSIEGPPVPQSTRARDQSQCDMGTSALSPSAMISPHGAPLSQQGSHKAQTHQNFERGGIKLKKKPSTNFGAPFGSLGGFGGPRKMS